MRSAEIAAGVRWRHDALPLASGDLAPEDALELEALKAQIRRESGLFCAGYKERCLRRRLAVRMRACGVHRYADYARVLEEDPEEYERLLRAVMINVSKFFRNLEVWDRVREEIMPALFALDVPEVRIWSAGSASGEEAYTAAILVREHAEAHGLEDRLARFSILGSDIDPDALDAARRAEYPPLALSETPAAQRERWFEEGPRFRLSDEIRRMARFEAFDLLTDSPPEEQHLIFCRNVTIYFERDVQMALLERLRDALVPGGYMVLGKAETLLGSIGTAFRAVSNRERIYQRI